MSQTDRIATLLASGLPATSIATIVGLSPSRIAQIQKEDGFDELLNGKVIELAAKDIEEVSLSSQYLAAEHILIKQVMEMAPVSELRDVTAALRVVSERQEKAKARMNPIIQGTPVYNTVVQLVLPQHATPELHLSAQKEVIAIENRNLAPLPSSGVLSLFKSMALSAKEELPMLTIEGNGNEPTRSITETTGSSQETLSSQSSSSSLKENARKFLDSLHPAPLGAGSF